MTFTRDEIERMGFTITDDGKAVRTAMPAVPPMASVRPSNWREKHEQQECYKVLRACGFLVWWLSQAQKSQQTAGVPDLLARHQGKALILWVEVKRPDAPAEWTPAQQDFARSCIEGKEHYIVGGEGKLRAWLSTQGWDV